MPSGRHSTSSAHQYFILLPEKSEDGKILKKCQIKDKDGKICGSQPIRSGDSVTNLKYHLQKCHPDIFKIVDETDKKSVKEKPAPVVETASYRQSTLEQSFSRRKTYDKNSIEAKKLDKAVALFFGGTNVPIATVENKLFRNMISSFDNRYKVPGRTKVTTLVDKKSKEIEKIIIQLLLEAKKITVTTDLWTKRDQTPFMGVTAHFFNRKDRKKYNIILALKEIGGDHTGANIFDTLMGILARWGIDKSKIFKTVTDNAANMIKAFKDQSVDNYSNEEEDEEDEEASGDEEEQGKVVTDEDDLEEDPEEEENFLADVNLDDSFVEDEDEQYDELQRQQESVWENKHMGCMVHLLQLVIRKLEKESTVKSAIDSAIAVVNSFKRSSKATMELKRLVKDKVLRSHCLTRWSSLYLMIERLLELKDHVITVCKKMNKDSPLPSQWNTLSQVKKLLEKFAIRTKEWEINNSTSISGVVPGINSLRKHLEKMIAGNICSASAKLLLTNLNNRFNRFTNATSERFDPIFIVATALDPQCKKYLDENQKKIAKEWLLDEIKKSTEYENNAMIVNAVQDTDGSTPAKRSRFEDLDEDVNETIIDGTEKAIEDEITRYLEAQIFLLLNTDPLDYWKSCVIYPRLADLALDILAAPCSSSASETLFSHAGFLSSGMRSRISAKNLENRIMIKCNHGLLA